jgi:antitoxin (DNA-binding transcriptional repressor) of toxin-antitoxin stability system
MRSVSISVTEAARNFADCVNRARYQGTTFVLRKNGVAVARIGPVERNPKDADELDAGDPAEGTDGKLSGEAAQGVSLRAPEIW